jgi:hypothetical protein
MVDNGFVPVRQELSQVIQCAMGVYNLVRMDVVLHPKGPAQAVGTAAQEGKPRLSSDLRELLKTSLGLAEAALQLKAPVVREDIREPHQLTSSPYVSSKPDRSPFEVMMWTGSWFPWHPVIRTIPECLQDHIARMARKSKSALKKADERMAALEKAAAEHVDRIQMEGTLCTKYKTSFRAITPGIFAVFCVRCGVCEGFEMMSHAESTLVPFRIFCHRMWTRKDAEVWERFKKTGKWKDDWMYGLDSEPGGTGLDGDSAE